MKKSPNKSARISRNVRKIFRFFFFKQPSPKIMWIMRKITTKLKKIRHVRTLTIRTFSFIYETKRKNETNVTNETHETKRNATTTPHNNERVRQRRNTTDCYFKGDISVNRWFFFWLEPSILLLLNKLLIFPLEKKKTEILQIPNLKTKQFRNKFQKDYFIYIIECLLH